MSSTSAKSMSLYEVDIAIMAEYSGYRLGAAGNYIWLAGLEWMALSTFVDKTLYNNVCWFGCGCHSFNIENLHRSRIHENVKIKENSTSALLQKWMIRHMNNSTKSYSLCTF